MALDPAAERLLDCLPCGAMIASEEGTIVSANAALHRLLGYAPPALVGRSVEELVPETSRVRHVHLRAGFGSGDGSRPMSAGRVVTARTQEGRPHFVEVGLAPCPLLGDGFMLATVLDVHERELLRRQVDMNADESESLVAEVIGGLAHQFNNQITAVIGTLELVLEDARSGPLYELLDYALAAAQRAGAVTDQLLGTDGIAGGASPRLSSTVRAIEPGLRAIVPPVASLLMDVPSGAARVNLGAHEIAQALKSLVRNAAAAVAPGGHIIVRLSVLDEQRLARLSVLDDGPGIPEEVLARLMSPVVAAQPDHRGAGMGLTSVAGIARQAGGALQLENRPEGGACATIVLPVLSAGAAVEPAEEPPRKGRILVVDDESMVRETVARALERRGHEVLLADGATEAVRLFKEAGSIDLLITDIVMPNVDGVELAQLLAGLNPGLRVLFMSGYSRDVLHGHGLSASGVELLPKPFTMSAATQRAERLLSDED
jgi:two-component system, cell cycle sensor histidine kinase and response regulator CckA